MCGLLSGRPSERRPVPGASELAELLDRCSQTTTNSGDLLRHEACRKQRRRSILEESRSARTRAASAPGARLYEGACAVCHQVGGPPLFGSRPSLALNSNLHSAVPDNLIQVILHGITAPVSSDLGYMPAFKDSMTDDQLAELVSYLRQQFAPDKPPWTGVRAAVSRARG